MGYIEDALRHVELPRMLEVRQRFTEDCLDNPAERLRRELDRAEIKELIHPGMRIAVTAGSRGLDCYVSILREIISFLKSQGAQPFIIPAKGSHGGANADGQTALLNGYGITEESIGAPILSSMEVVQVDTTADGEPVWVDRIASKADGIVLFNRIKPHTGFIGDYESGLVKMAAIGLGKQRGAETVHFGGPAHMSERVRDFGIRAIKHSRVLFGVGTVENSLDKVYDLRALTVPEILSEEPKLLKSAKELLPRIFFEKLDVLIVDRIGKNISGPGMDPNITRTYLPDAAIPEELRKKRAKRVAVLDLTKETHGAAMGIGMADVTTRRLFEKLDRDVTYPNCLTSGVTVSAKLPMWFDNDELTIKAAVQTLTGSDRNNLRIVRILDTLHLGKIWISEALAGEAEENKNVEVLSELEKLQFDENGNLF